MGYDQQDQSNSGLDSAYPGPIDNSTLFEGIFVWLINVAMP